MTSESVQVVGSGGVAQLCHISRPRLLYLIEKGVLPGPSYMVAGRRMFTEEDVQLIAAELDRRPELRLGRADTQRCDAEG